MYCTRINKSFLDLVRGMTNNNYSRKIWDDHTEKVSTAKELLTKISPWNFNSKYVFRGQSEDWELVPSMWRKDNQIIEKFLKEILSYDLLSQELDEMPIFQHDLITRIIKTNCNDSKFFREYFRFVPNFSIEHEKIIANTKLLIKHLLFERLVIYHASLALDEAGLGYYDPDPIPFVFMEMLRKEIRSAKELFDPFIELDIQRTLKTLLGIGQHHGLPTRILDWTNNPFVAAYFAAIGVKDSKDMIIWCVEVPNEKGVASFAPPAPIYVGNYVVSSLVFRHLPESDNTDLFKQQGLFQYITNANLHFLVEGKWPSIENFLFKNFNNKIKGISFQPLRKVLFWKNLEDFVTIK